jgi:ectoine hydroxylase-related dioxygenase (phytanoyl-CoA dioxygenase family)
LDQDGFALVPKLAAGEEIAALLAFFDTAQMSRATRGGETFGVRNLLCFSEVRQIAASPRIAACLMPLLGPGYRPVRGLFFDKTEAANWPVLWHQDLTLAVRERHELPGWTNWSIKQGVPHVQPPTAILARMVTMRLHLDDCDSDSGPLRVIPGSHRNGILDRATIRAETGGGLERAILAEAGDAFLMRPLLLHTSSPATRPRHRRVLHLEFAPEGLLPVELAWAAA